MRTTFLALTSLLALGGAAAAQTPPATEKAVFAGGCFWCMESTFEEVKGVKAVISGYTGGTKKDPSYEEVSSGGTGHAEAVEVEYDPAVVTYAQLLDVFWHNVDPTDDGGQFCDRGDQYTSEIFTLDPGQMAAATASKAKLEKTKGFKAPIVTRIVSAGAFYPAEGYHQDYYKKNPVRYRWYRQGCGRDARLKTLWGAPK